MKTRMLALALVFALCLVPLLSGCSSKEVACRAFADQAKSIVKPEYLEANPVKGLLQGGSQNSPENRTVIIRDHQTLNSIFTAFPHTVDFSKETVVLYMSLSMSMRARFLSSATLENGTLSVTIASPYSNPNRPDAVKPYQRCYYLIVESTDFDSAVFTWH